MSSATPTSTPPRRFVFNDAKLHQCAVAATVILPLCLLYARAVSDILVSLTGVLFLIHSARTRDWSWLRQPWVRLAAAFYALQLVATLHSGTTASIFQSVAVIRLLLFIAALEAWVLVRPSDRHVLRMVLLAAALWVAVQCWQQYVFGTNFAGYPRWSDGALTGPFYQPRAGSVWLMTALLGVLPSLVIVLQRRVISATMVGCAGLVLVLTTAILIGQRMPTMLMVMGFAITALLIPRLRRPVLLAGLVGVLALLALPFISPPTYAKLVLRFIEQMSHFPDSPYGQLYIRAAVMVEAHPWLGLGFTGFRSFCPDPAYFHDLAWLGITSTNIGADACNIHPHNYYFEVATMAGLPGLALFLAMLVAWFRRIASSLQPTRNPQHAVLFVAFCVVFWPLASTSSLFVFDTAGWVILTTGWALAASRPSAAL